MDETLKKNPIKNTPRIYNLFPLLIGKIPLWLEHLKRIKNMGFNWIFINPINYPGFSGSLYSIKNYFRLNPKFAVDEEDQKTWDSFHNFCKKAHELGIKIMVDLVINHTAIDAVDKAEKAQYFKESWYKKKFALIEILSNQVIRFFEDDEDPIINEYPPDDFILEPRIANPFAIDPADTNRVTIWGDLAELNYDSKTISSEILSYWKKLLNFYNELGIDGYRCDAAYKIPPKIWKDIIEYYKQKSPNSLFWAETLGCKLSECEAISDQFDFIASSVKYWDFTKPWAVEQYNNFRVFAPAISFPESHDTERLAKESGENRDIQIFRYLFSCFFTAGVCMPLGYEYGFKKKMSVTDSEPKDWEEGIWDLTEEISNMNEFKSKFQCLNEDGKITHFDYSNSGILIISTLIILVNILYIIQE